MKFICIDKQLIVKYLMKAGAPNDINAVAINNMCHKKKRTTHINSAFNVLRNSTLLNPHTFSSIVAIDGHIWDNGLVGFQRRDVGNKMIVGSGKCCTWPKNSAQIDGTPVVSGDDHILHTIPSSTAIKNGIE